MPQSPLLLHLQLLSVKLFLHDGTNPTKGEILCHMSICFMSYESKRSGKNCLGDAVQTCPNSLLQMKSDNSLTSSPYLIWPELRESNISFRTIASDLVLSPYISILCHSAVVYPVPHTCLCQLLLQLLSGLQFLGSAEEICELVESTPACLFYTILVLSHYTQYFDINTDYIIRP